MRAAARILLLEAEALRPVLEAAPAESFDRPTVCDGWSVRDVLAHCGAALSRTAGGNLHRFTPDDNQRDVDERRAWPLGDVLAELFAGYEAAAAAIDAARGPLDGIGLGEWVHGGDVREALGARDPYGSAGIDLAVDLLAERSARMGKPPVAVRVGDRELRFGGLGDPAATLRTDAATFVRLCAGRGPDRARYELTGVSPGDLVLFS